MTQNEVYGKRALELIPGGAHTYSRTDEVFPENAPKVFERTKGVYAWDVDGNKYLDYAMACRSVTVGYVSALNRKLTDSNGNQFNLIQTDAAINTGNSGGPLINKNGEVIGINSIKITSAEGIGFAIPINIIKPIIESYIQTGKFEEGYLGIFAYDTEVNKYLNSSLDFNNGIYVVKISADGPALRSGLKVGDIITKIDDREINKMSELRNYIYTKAPGDKVNLIINRNNKEYAVEITLGKR